MSYFDPFTHREISESTFDDRIVEYQLDRELIADRLEYAVDRYDDAHTARSQDYWDSQIDDLRSQLAEYDQALGAMADQVSDDFAPADYDALDRLDVDDGGDPDHDWDWAGSEGDAIEEYLEDYPDYWDIDFDDYGDEWEFDVDYVES